MTVTNTKIEKETETDIGKETETKKLTKNSRVPGGVHIEGDGTNLRGELPLVLANKPSTLHGTPTMKVIINASVLTPDSGIYVGSGSETLVLTTRHIAHVFDL